MSEVYCEADIQYMNAPLRTKICNARQSDDFSWRTNGFELIHHETSATDWDHDLARYSQEIRELALNLSGADHIMWFPSIERSPRARELSEDYAPIQFAHSDYTETYYDMIKNTDHPYRAILQSSIDASGITEDDIQGATRILTLQFWRNIGAGNADYPLALCDARTVRRRNLEPVLVEDYGGVPTRFEAFAVTSSRLHRWYTYPAMQIDELLVFRAYDSDLAEQEQPFWTPHTAFLDPHGDTPRRSIESRAICLFS